MGKKIDLQSADYFCLFDRVRKPLLGLISTSDCFLRGNSLIIKAVGMRKIADYFDIKETDIVPMCSPSESNLQKHWVKVFITDPHSKKVTVATGEADRLNTGKWSSKGEYKEHDQIDAQFRGSMAEKRAFDRAIIKHLQIYNTYSEIEAQDFKAPSPKYREEPETYLDAGSEITSDNY